MENWTAQKIWELQKVNKKLSLRLGAHKTAGNTDPHPMRGDVDEFLCV